jgi:hypothetical protein
MSAWFALVTYALRAGTRGIEEAKWDEARLFGVNTFRELTLELQPEASVIAVNREAIQVTRA